jgi:MFS superfamily sulfate permease-like transporter
MKGFHDLTHNADTVGTPGLLLYRFGAGIVFFNASYLKKRVLELTAIQPDLKWVVIDGSTVNTIDSTGAETLEALAGDLGRKGIRLGLAGFRTETRSMLQRTGALAAIGTDFVYPTLKSAVNAFLAVRPGSLVIGPEANHGPAEASGEGDAK